MPNQCINIKSVNFCSGDGLRLSGELYMAEYLDEDSKAPAIVLCQGLSGEKHKVLPLVANAFASAGYVTLAFDYGGCGHEKGNCGRK